MNVKRVKRKCMVKGCRNKDTYALSKLTEFGNSVIICEDCLKAAANSVEAYDMTEPVRSVLKREPPALFFSDALTLAAGQKKTTQSKAKPEKQKETKQKTAGLEGKKTTALANGGDGGK